MRGRQTKWWKNVFDEKYLDTYIDVLTPQRTKRQVAFLQNILIRKRARNILDVACGHGRHSFALAKLGFCVVGIDQSKRYIGFATTKSAEQNLPATFIQADMRYFKFPNRFDAVICMFTSFGYFKKESDNWKTLKKINAHLKYGGILILDLNNLFRVMWHISNFSDAKYQKQILSGSEKSVLSNGLRVLTKHHIDFHSTVWRMIRSWKKSGKKKSYQTRVRLYMLPEIKYAIEKCGFRIESVLGDFNNSPYSLKSKRMIILAIKK